MRIPGNSDRHLADYTIYGISDVNVAYIGQESDKNNIQCTVNLPDASSATASGVHNLADVATPLSPL